MHSFVFGRGEAQGTRTARALAPSSASVDERALPEMLAYLAELARLIGFVDEQGRPAGDWTPFLSRDASFLLAQVCATTADAVTQAAAAALQSELDHAQATGAGETARPAAGAPVLGEQKPGAERTQRRGGAAAAQSSALARIFTLARRIDDWYDAALQLESAGLGEHPFKRNLEQVIGQDLSRYTLAIAADRTLGPLWRRLAERADVHFGEVWSNDAGRSVSFDPDDLASVETAFRRSLDSLAELARRYLESGQEDGEHAPHAGLLIAFVKLLGVVQGELNTFTGRHLDYYLREVLRLAPRPSQPDRSFVAFALAPGASPVLLDAGRRLTAGVDAAGAPIEFATDAPLVVTQAAIASRMALSVGYAQSPALNGKPPASAERAPIASVLAFPCADSADGLGLPLADPTLGWPPFGPDRASAVSAGNAAPDAPLGFIVASPLLLLAGGERTIRLALAFDEADAERDAQAAPGAAGEARPPTSSTSSVEGGGTAGQAAASGNTVSQRLEQLATDYAAWLTQHEDGGPVSPEAVLEGLLADACLVTLSGAQGWFAPRAARLAVTGGGTVELLVELSAAAPAVVANAALSLDAAHGEAPLPMLKVVMNPQSPVYGYSFFEALSARRLNLSVSVRGLSALSLQSNLGPIALGKPFQPFGPAPILGGYLQIGAPELACKPVADIGVTLDWLNLPASGFAAYYEGYPPEPDGSTLSRSSFQATLTRNDGVAWRSASEASGGRVALFAPATAGGFGSRQGTERAAPSTRFAFTGGAAVADSAAAHDDAGALRITLAAPSGAFGYDVYSRALAEAVLANARASRRASKAELAPIPNPPWVPTASAVSLDYTAQASLTFEALDRGDTLRFYALAPFGHVRMRHRFEPCFVPDGVRGALCLGLTGVAPGDTVTLLVQLADRHAPQQIDFTRDLGGQAQGAGGARNGLVWYYLADNRWQPFRKEDVQSDATYGLTSSGIVALTLPVRLDAKSTLMPAGCVWIAAMAFEGVETMGNVVALLPNAVTATRVTSGQTVIANLPPGAISGLTAKLPAIKTVAQPIATVGGSPAETDAAFATRVAERLRHKQRAIQPYDYERLVLEAFADIAQVKCIGPGNSGGYAGAARVPAGEIVLAVTAPMLAVNAPSYVPQATLRAVLDLLRPYVSPFLRRLTVRNPSYEQVKVVAAVRLKPGKSATFYLNELAAELDSALTPWLAQGAQRQPIGYGAIDGNAVASFIRQREYVAELVEFHIEVIYNVSADGTGNDWRVVWFDQNQHVRPSTPWSMLVPADSHRLELAGADSGKTPDLAPAGIGSYTIGEDFVAAPSTSATTQGAAPPATQRTYYVKFLEREMHRGARRERSRDDRFFDVEAIEDAFIDFPDQADASRDSAADGPTDSNEA